VKNKLIYLSRWCILNMGTNQNVSSHIWKTKLWSLKMNQTSQTYQKYSKLTDIVITLSQRIVVSGLELCLWRGWDLIFRIWNFSFAVIFESAQSWKEIMFYKRVSQKFKLAKRLGQNIVQPKRSFCAFWNWNFGILDFIPYNWRIVGYKVEKTNLSSNPGTTLHPCLRRRW
jgi:hypothetical protein